MDRFAIRLTCRSDRIESELREDEGDAAVVHESHVGERKSEESKRAERRNVAITKAKADDDSSDFST